VVSMPRSSLPKVIIPSPYGGQSDSVLKVPFSATLGQEPEVEISLV
jgi:hypothetical protein